MRGYFAIGIYHTKTEINVGTLWRGAYLYEAAFIFTIGRRYKKESSDTQKTWRNTPLFNLRDYEEFKRFIPFDCQVIGIEQGGELLATFKHPERCIYLLGAEDHGLPPEVLAKMQRIVSIETVKPQSMNVASAGLIVMHDRLVKS